MLKWLGGLVDSNEKALRRLQPLVEEINELEPDFRALSDEALKSKTQEFKLRLTDGTAAVVEELTAAQAELDEAQKRLAVAESEFDREEADSDRKKLQERVERLEKERQKVEESVLEELLPEAFAAVREAARRAIGQRHFDVQLLGGIVLHQGRISEMKTGEGKTLVATLPLYLNSLTGRGCHLVTVNDYLARRDPYWMAPVYNALGLSVASIYPQQNPDELTPARLYDATFDSGDKRWGHFRTVTRQEAYKADITYGTSAEFGFDYLRDNMVLELPQCVQRPTNYAIVDEVDNLLIDEARTPLIISAPDEEAAQRYAQFAHLVPRLRSDVDYKVNEKERTVSLTDEGISSVEQMLKRDGILKSAGLYDAANYGLTRFLDNALKAQVLYRKDREYVVKNGEVIIVDEFTGRLMVGRRYSEGLHQAIEAKEHVKVQRETRTYATITIQNYFRMYRKLGGMTGTALTEAEEFSKIYKLDVLPIPTNKPMIREDSSDRIYKDEDTKYRAVVRDIAEMNKAGRPVLVGTVSIQKSELIAEMLTRKGVSHQVLNAKQHEKEADIIAQAGLPGAVTVATNMAGRGVDIILGGIPPNYRFEQDMLDYQQERILEFTRALPKELFAELKGDIEERITQSLTEVADAVRMVATTVRAYEAAYKSYVEEFESAVNLRRKEVHDEEYEKRKHEAEVNISQKLSEVSASKTLLQQRLKHHNETADTVLQQLKDKSKATAWRQIIGDGARLPELIEDFDQWRKRRLKVLEAGGLHVVGTERHEARRIDNQLRGRAGRQGDPGSTRFYVSLEDDIMRRFGGERIKSFMEWAGMDEDTPIENALVNKTIGDTQKRVEGYHFDMRKHLVEYDDVVNKHREVIYGERKKILGGANLRANIMSFVRAEMHGIAAGLSRSPGRDEYEERDGDAEAAGFLALAAAIFPPSPDLTAASLSGLKPDEVEDRLTTAAEAAYQAKEQEIGAENMRVVERLVMLRIIDSLWVEHLTNMEHMREGIGLMAVGQRDPLIAYKKEGMELFQNLLDTISHDVAHTIYHLSIKRETPAPSPMAKVVKSSAGTSAKQVGKVGGKKVGRNDPCPCGSGKKYKVCCGK